MPSSRAIPFSFFKQIPEAVDCGGRRFVGVMDPSMIDEGNIDKSRVTDHHN